MNEEETKEVVMDEMKEFVVNMTIAGTATGIVKAKNEEEAWEKAKKHEFEEGSDELSEWEWDEIESIDDA